MKKLISITLICILTSSPLFASNISKFLIGSAFILVSAYGGEHQFNLEDKSKNAKSLSDNAFALSETYKISDPVLSDAYLASSNSYLNDSENYKQDMKVYQGVSASCLIAGTCLTTASLINTRKQSQKEKPKFNPYQFFGSFFALRQSVILYNAARFEDNTNVRTLNTFLSASMFALGIGCISNNIDILIAPQKVKLSYKF